MKSHCVIAALALFLLHLPHSFVAADEDRGADQVQRDLAKLQGKWELTLRVQGGAIRNVQTIKGTTSTVERFDENDELLHSHTASFKLSFQERVRIFTFFDLRVTEGPQKGQGFKGPRSFIYVLQPNAWIEARGLLADQNEGAAHLMTWKRIIKDEVSANGPLSPHVAAAVPLR